MIEMTPAARERLDDYMRRMQSQLRASRSVAADDVEQSVREHIEVALEHAAAPVGATEVIGVLDRLGPPERWLAEEDQPSWRGLFDQFFESADDWRLAFIVFGLFLASMLLFQLVGPLLIVPAMLASRAYVELARERGQALGARRWLVYPAIALVLGFVMAIFLIGPPLSFSVASAERQLVQQMFDVPRTDAGLLRFNLGVGGVLFGSWWIIAAAFCSAFLRPIRFVFAPLLDEVGRKHFAVLAAIGAIVAAAGVILLV